MKRLIVLAVAMLVPAAAFARNSPVTGYRAEVLANVAEVQDKIMQLAEAVPASKYSWRPAKGVRSVSEVYMHIAGANYFLLTFIGRKPPANVPPDMEKITDKQRVLAELRKSFDYLREAVAAEPEADLAKSVKMFGNPTTHRGVLLTATAHLHEHLGQSIAYARMNGVVPPWSR